MANPGGVDLNTSPYFDDYDEGKKFVRILYRPGRAVQARELTQAQTLSQAQIKRFAEYFFKQGSIVDGCEQSLDLNLNFVKLQSTYDSAEVDVTDFEGKTIFGANTGVKAYAGIVSDLEGSDPKTLFINYLSTGSIVLTVNNAASTLTPGNTITFSTGNTAIIEASYIDPILGTNKIFVTNNVGALTTTTANTVDSTGALIALNVTAISDNRTSNVFSNNETIFTSDVATRAYAQSVLANATRHVVNAGLATEKVYDKGSKITVSDGIVWMADHFVNHTNQTIVLDKYSNEPSYKIGLVPQRSFVDYIEDQTLVDNAQGTPNFQAPGADRLKIDTVLTKVALGEATDENEFVTLTEIDGGVTRKRKQIDVESKLEDVLAKRTQEESGNYTITDPTVTVVEHLNTGTNNGRYSSTDGGNTNLLVVDVDPFTAYVSGYRNQLIVKTPVELEKGLTNQYVEQTKTQINYGNYIEVKELSGAWDLMESTKIDLYDTLQSVITAGTVSTASVTGTKIGEARVRSVEFVSGTKGTPTATYRIYLYEVAMNSGKNFSQVRALYDSATPKRFADVILDTSGNAKLQETSYDTMIFKLPYNAIKTIRDTLENVESGFRFKKKFTVTFSGGVATVVTDVISEIFVGNGVLNATQKDDNYMVVVNNGGTNVETTALTGTVTVSAGGTSVTGSGTQFTTQLNVGDFIKIGTQTVRISAIGGSTSLTLATAHTAGASGVTYTKILPAGYVIPLASQGGSGSARSVEVATGGSSVTINIQENATFTADVIVSMDRANAKEKKKTLNYQTQANIQPNTHPELLAGPYSLGYGDIYRLHAVYQSTDFLTPATTANTNVTQYFTLDNGQRDSSYEHGTITPVAGFVPSGRLLAIFDHFLHDVSQGVGYCSVDSYPIDDNTISNTTITTSDIPLFTSPKTGAVYDLRDCLDFRPIKTASTGLNPSDPGTYQIPTFGLRIPAPSSDFDADLIFYKGRIAKVYINSKGTFGINNGVPASAGNQLAESPPAKPDTLEIAELFVPPYPSRPKDVTIKLLKNRRFTMKDVGRINERLERVEYFTALSLLEKQATEKTILDDTGIERFKNGILVDPFSGHSVSNTQSPDWKAAINKNERYATSWQINTNASQLKYNSAASTATKTEGNKVMIPWTEVEAPGLKQPYASKQLRLAEELNFFWTGNMKIVPYVDNFFETENDPNLAVVYNDNGDAENWRTLINAWNSQVAPLNQWLGDDVEKTYVAGTTQTGQQGNYQVTTQLQRSTQEQFKYQATINQQTTPKQEVSFSRVVKVETPFFMRQREFAIKADGLKDNARMYAFFDNIDVTENCYQIRLLGTTKFEELNDLYDNNGYLTGEGSAWEAIADGSAGDPFYVRQGELILLFLVPQRKFYVGQREFKVTDSATNSEGTAITSARQTVFAQGVKSYSGDVTINSRPYSVSFTGKDNIVSLGRKVVREERVETGRVWNPPRVSTDPLSQSFYVEPNEFPKGFYLTSIDLYFKTKSENPFYNVRVELREVDNGFPSPRFIGVGDEAVVNNMDIFVSEDATAPTNFAFKNPIYLKPGNEYCFAIKPDGNDPSYAIWVAELGAIDITNPDLNTRIESAYNAGVLFSSSNDRTWTAKQNTDVKFTMKIADFGTSSKTAVWENVSVANSWLYDTLTPGLSDQVLPGTNIKYEIKMADASYAVDEEYTEVKNYEELVLRARKQISNTSIETSEGFKSLSLRATLSTTNQYVTPYIDDESTVVYFSKNEINNASSTSVTGTVQYSSGSNIVTGSGTTFTTQVFPGEYGFFGEEYRKIASVANNTYLVVTDNFTTSNAANQTMTIRNEENPSGPYASESRYITKVVTLNDGFEASDLAVYMNINRPPGTAIKVYYKILNENDTDRFDDKFYQEMELVGSETFTEDRHVFKEEKYVVPTATKTGGAELLSGTVAVYTANTNVFGTSTRFIEELKIGDTIAVGTARTERVVATIANNTYLTVESAFASNASGQDAFKVLNNEVAYTTPDGRTFTGYKYFAIKVVFLSANPLYAPRIKDLRGIALA